MFSKSAKLMHASRKLWKQYWSRIYRKIILSVETNSWFNSMFLRYPLPKNGSFIVMSYFKFCARKKWKFIIYIIIGFKNAIEFNEVNVCTVIMEIFIKFFETRNTAVNGIETEMSTISVLKISEPLFILKRSSGKKNIIEAVAFNGFRHKEWKMLNNKIRPVKLS